MHPVKMENITAGQIARTLLEKPQQYVHTALPCIRIANCCRAEVNFQKHAGVVSRSSEIKLVRYQVNPTANWGPKPRAKRKRDDPEDKPMAENTE
jgi:tRNA (guanine26-N2/guanine27-N2)-dimethyltransferase